MKKHTNFSPYIKPYRPSKPRETLPEGKGKLIKEGVNYDVVPIPPGVTSVYVELEGEMYGDGYLAQIYEYHDDLIPNPDYEENLIKYKKDLEKYNRDIKEWKEQKKLYDEEQKQERERLEKETFLK